MVSYKLVKNLEGNVCAVNRSDGWSIPFAPANTDYRNFKAQINDETAQLQDADGNLMSAQQAKAYVATLP